MATFSIIVGFVLLIRPLGADWVAIDVETEPVRILSLQHGENITLRCSGPCTHRAELKDKSESKTFQQIKDHNGTPLPNYYVNISRSESPNDSVCFENVYMTANEEINGKEFQCILYSLPDFSSEQYSNTTIKVIVTSGNLTTDDEVLTDVANETCSELGLHRIQQTTVLTLILMCILFISLV